MHRQELTFLHSSSGGGCNAGAGVRRGVCGSLPFRPPPKLATSEAYEPKVGRLVGRSSYFLRLLEQKSRARLASPQSRPTSPVNGAGGITGCRDDSQAPGVVPAVPNFFCTRLSEGGFPEPCRFPRVVLVIAMGRGTNEHVTDITWNFRCDRDRADLWRRPVCVRPGSRRRPAGSGGRGAVCRQSHRQGRSRGQPGTDRCSDPDDLPATERSFRYLGSGPRARRPGGPQSIFRALPAESRQRQAGRGLRAHGQRPDRNRQAASARPLRHLNVLSDGEALDASRRLTSGAPWRDPSAPFELPAGFLKNLIC